MWVRSGHLVFAQSHVEACRVPVVPVQQTRTQKAPVFKPEGRVRHQYAFVLLNVQILTQNPLTISQFLQVSVCLNCCE